MRRSAPRQNPPPKRGCAPLPAAESRVGCSVLLAANRAEQLTLPTEPTVRASNHPREQPTANATAQPPARPAPGRIAAISTSPTQNLHLAAGEGVLSMCRWAWKGAELVPLASHHSGSSTSFLLQVELIGSLLPVAYQ